MLDMKVLREKNIARLSSFKDINGNKIHKSPTGADWSAAQWLQAVVGELGEYANIRKKFERGDLTYSEFHKLASEELADTAIYLDILAHNIGVDLEQAIIEKFNIVSDRICSDIKL